MLPKALKSCPKSIKLPNPVTLVGRQSVLQLSLFKMTDVNDLIIGGDEFPMHI